MKKLVAILGLMISSLSLGQDFEKVSESKLYKKELYKNFISWSSENKVFVKNKEIVVNDEENGQVITRVEKLEKKLALKYGVKTTIKLDVKDQKYRLSISDPIIKVSVNPDFNVDVPNHPFFLKEAKGQLEGVKDVSYRLKNVMEWSYQDLKVLLVEQQEELSKLREEGKELTKKSDIRYNEYKIKRLENEI